MIPSTLALSDIQTPIRIIIDNKHGKKTLRIVCPKKTAGNRGNDGLITVDLYQLYVRMYGMWYVIGRKS